MDDKNREGKLNKLLMQFQNVSSGLDIIRKREGTVKNSKFRYFFVSFETSLGPNVINWGNFKYVKKDSNLYEREKGSIEDYVADFYEL